MQYFFFMASIAIWCLILLFSLIAFFDSKSGIARFAKSGLYHRIQIALGILGLACLTLSMIMRAIITGHGPFSNMYEFSIAFSWGVMAMSILFLWRYRMPPVFSIASAIATALLIFASSLSSKPVPLVPALQQSYLLTAHVATAVIAYGALTIAFVAALIYLFTNRTNSSSEGAELLDDMGYRAVIIGFPFMTLLIILGALWADIAWGRYWGWDPKETASLVTWLLYAGYIHSRVMRGWRGRRSAVLLVLGFAAILFTFFGNYIFSGLHSYG